MLEQLDYLIRTLTYKRSCLECDLRKYNETIGVKPGWYEDVKMEGKIEGLSIALTELYKMVVELTKDDE